MAITGTVSSRQHAIVARPSATRWIMAADEKMTKSESAGSWIVTGAGLEVEARERAAGAWVRDGPDVVAYAAQDGLLRVGVGVLRLDGWSQGGTRAGKECFFWVANLQSRDAISGKEKGNVRNVLRTLRGRFRNTLEKTGNMPKSRFVNQSVVVGVGQMPTSSASPPSAETNQVSDPGPWSSLPPW